MHFPEIELDTPPKFEYDNFAIPENVHMTFRLRPHNSAADLPEEAELRKEMARHDAVVIEGFTRDDDSISMSKVAKGDTKAYTKIRDTDHTFSGWTQRMSSALFASRIKVTSIDVRASSTNVSTLESTQARYVQAFRMAQTEDQALSHMPLYLKYTDALKQRDQQTLENIVPRLGALGILNVVNREEPAKVLAFYGPTHRSLVSALQHKQDIDQIDGFSVSIHDDSDDIHASDIMYGLSIRGIDIPSDMYLHDHAMKLITQGLDIGGYIDMQSMPISQVDDLTLKILGDKSYAEAHDIFKALVTKQYTLDTSDLG